MFVDGSGLTDSQNPTAWNLRGKIGFLWAPIAALLTLWAFFRLPEMKVSFYVARRNVEVKIADWQGAVILRA